MLPRRRIIYLGWLKELARTWAQQEGLTTRQMQARLAEIGLHMSLSTIAGWFSRAQLVKEHVQP